MRQWTTAKVGETGFVVSERPDTEDRFLVSTIASAQSPEALAMLLPAMRTVFMHNICRWREYSLAPVLRAMIRDCKGRTRDMETNDVDPAAFEAFIEQWGVNPRESIRDFILHFGTWLADAFVAQSGSAQVFPENDIWLQYKFKDTSGEDQKIFVEPVCYHPTDHPDLYFGEVHLYPSIYGHNRDIIDTPVIVVALLLNEKGEILDI